VPAAMRHQELALDAIPRKDIAQLLATLERIEENIEGGD